MSHNGVVRVRYAPSPTGLQHIGGIRTALFNYLFARSNGGQFILRIEDTDQNRSQNIYVQDLYESLDWLGIHVDEGPPDIKNISVGINQNNENYGPYIQSQRLGLYQKYAHQLLQERKAYYCFCSEQRLQQLRKQQEQSKISVQGYDLYCRNLDPIEAEARCKSGESCVLRFAIPLEGNPQIIFRDILLGNMEKAHRDISPDPVILKADGFPTYHLANVIDDHCMRITHVLRAQEWLSSGPLHLLLYQAFGWQPPQFCHLPMVMGQEGTKLAKLSKRHGSTALLEFRKAGYLREAILNYIALLGWAFDDKREFFTLPELEQCFDLAKLSHSPAIFDYQKLEWFNGQYIRQMEIPHLQELLPDVFWQRQLPEVYKPLPKNFTQSLKWILPLLQERLKFLNDAPAMATYFFVRPEYSQPFLALPKKHSAQQTIALLERSHAILIQLCSKKSDWQDFAGLMVLKKDWESAFRTAAEEAGIKMGALMQPLRYAITGSIASPPLLESMIILQRLAGESELLTRLTILKQLLEKQL